MTYGLEKQVQSQSKVNNVTFVGLAVFDLVGFALRITFLSLAVLTQFDFEFSMTFDLERQVKGQSKVNGVTFVELAVFDLVVFKLGITFLSLTVMTQFDFEFATNFDLENQVKGQSEVNHITFVGLAVLNIVWFALGITFLSLTVLA